MEQLFWSLRYGKRCFFIFEFALKLLTAPRPEEAVRFVTLRLLLRSEHFVGRRFVNQSEIEFVLYFVLRLVAWRLQTASSLRRRCIVELVKMSCSKYPKNRYFLSWIELCSRCRFEARSIYKSLLTDARTLNAASLSLTDRGAAPQLVAWIKYLVFELKNGASSSCLVAAFNDALLVPECRHNAAFWRLYLCFLWYRHRRQFGGGRGGDIDIDIEHHHHGVDQVDGAPLDALSRYQRQRMRRRRQLALDQKQQSLDRLKGVVQMSVQTVCRSKLLYLFGLRIMRRCCSEHEVAEYQRFIRTKRVQI